MIGDGWRTDPALRGVWVASVTLGAAVGVFAFSFGVTSVSAGASVLQTCAISAFVFTGASQFSLVSVIGAGGSAAAAYGGAALLAARNAVYGIALAPHLRPRGVLRKLVTAHLVLDETTAMAMTQHDPEHRRAAFWITGLTLCSFWNVGTLVGALVGSAIDPATFGLDAAFPAAFLAMLWPLLRDARSRLAAALGAVVCVSLVPLTPVGVPILCAAGAILVGVPAPRRRQVAP